MTELAVLSMNNPQRFHIHCLSLQRYLLLGYSRSNCGARLQDVRLLQKSGGRRVYVRWHEFPSQNNTSRKPTHHAGNITNLGSICLQSWTSWTLSPIEDWSVSNRELNPRIVSNRELPELCLQSWTGVSPIVNSILELSPIVGVKANFYDWKIVL